VPVSRSACCGVHQNAGAQSCLSRISKCALPKPEAMGSVCSQKRRRRRRKKDYPPFNLPVFITAFKLLPRRLCVEPVATCWFHCHHQTPKPAGKHKHNMHRLPAQVSQKNYMAQALHDEVAVQSSDTSVHMKAPHSLIHHAHPAFTAFVAWKDRLRDVFQLPNNFMLLCRQGCSHCFSCCLHYHRCCCAATSSSQRHAW
jgi:hypothetical protein